MRGRSSGAGRPARVVDVQEADRGLAGVLEVLDSAERYRGWILELAQPYLQGASRILEVGAGHGTFTVELARLGHVTAAELGRTALERLHRRFDGEDGVTVVDVALEGLATDAFDVALLSNVLEHIEDDDAALTELRRVVRPGGAVIVLSPAFPLLYSRFDAAVGHHRRYRLPDLRRRFERADLRVEEARYVNSLGFVSWLLLVRLLGATPENRRLVGLFDRAVVPLLRRLERRWSPPFGQSVFVVGRA